MYQINVYANERLQSVLRAFNAPDAIAQAYAYIGTNGIRVAHIMKDATHSGLYIARCTDPSRASFADLVTNLEKVKWDGE